MTQGREKPLAMDGYKGRSSQLCSHWWICQVTVEDTTPMLMCMDLVKLCGSQRKKHNNIIRKMKGRLFGNTVSPISVERRE